MTQPAKPASTAYFSMEIALDAAIPTYSGGLGVLAGDSLRAAADLNVPMVGVTLIHRKGYFRQSLDEEGHQSEAPAAWTPDRRFEELPGRVSVRIEGRDVALRAWRFEVHGCPGNESASTVPVYLLDADLPENDGAARALTNELYGGDSRYRLSQEAILGMGGVALLRSLGYEDISTYHMNEGHSGLLALALLKEQLGGAGADEASERDIEAVRSRCVFTVHTPVPAGHDTFPRTMVEEVLGKDELRLLELAPAFEDDIFDLTSFVIHFSRHTNGVSMRHAQISRNMFPGYTVGAITNGVHAGTWIADPIARMLDRHEPEWRHDTRFLRYAAGIPLDEIRLAHLDAKRGLLREVEQRNGVQLNENTLTIGFARRATGYKRGDLIFSDLERLRRLIRRAGPLQVIYSGKAHPRDEAGKSIIQHVFSAAHDLQDAMTITYIEDYDMAIAKYMCAGVDLWLNNPQKPLEASGTSGMKAAMNGVPSLSVLDGWWVEGHIEGVTGWAIGDENPASEEAEIASLYDKLEHAIMPMYYRLPDDYARVMRNAISLNGEFFSAQRMMNQYVRSAYAGPAAELG